MRLIAGITLLVLLSVPVYSQSTEAPSATQPATAFDIADVHVSPARRFAFVDGGTLRGDRYVLRQATMVDMIAAAYKEQADNVQGGPSWLETDRFDVFGKAPASTPADTVKLMLRSLLADRFKLVVHNGSKPMPAFVLSVGGGKPKLKEAEDTANSGCNPSQQTSDPGTVPYIFVSCRNMTMEAFAQALHDMAGGYLTNIVVDSTGLKGSWDFDLKWTGRGDLARAGADGISIFDAVDKQLGLKLELKTAPRPVLIVDSVNEQPTANPPDLETKLPKLPPPQFDVSVIKPSKPDAQFNGRVDGGQVNVTATTLKFLINFAWDLNPNDKEELVGAPGWLDSDHFDIMAKKLGDASGSAAQNAPQMDENDLKQMLRGLLRDRFKMQAHMEDRTVTAYNLVAVSPKLKKADPSSRTRCIEGPGPDGKDPRIAFPVLNRLLTCQNMTMAQIGVKLQDLASGYIYNPILDTTGIPGSYDFTLSFSSADLAGGVGGGPAGGGATGASDPNGALSLFDALTKEMGLKLEKVRRPAPALVIDHIEEKPTEN